MVKSQYLKSSSLHWQSLPSQSLKNSELRVKHPRPCLSKLFETVSTEPVALFQERQGLIMQIHRHILIFGVVNVFILQVFQAGVILIVILQNWLPSKRVKQVQGDKRLHLRKKTHRTTYPSYQSATAGC